VELSGTTDDASVIERMGEPVLVVEGDPRNIKITSVDDLALARAIMNIAPPADRAAVAAGLRRALKPGGLLVLECFSPAQEGRRSGGPRMPELLFTRAIMEQEFAGFEVLVLLEGAVRLDEGPKHQGLAEVVRAVLRKPAI
jgi:SAM-dependent methyltransferase